jgi:hypothetical protein
MTLQTTTAAYWKGWNEAMLSAADFFQKQNSDGPLGAFPGNYVAAQLRGMRAVLDENGEKSICNITSEQMADACAGLGTKV